MKKRLLLLLLFMPALLMAQRGPTVTDQLAPLHIAGYPGNSITAVLNFTATAPSSLTAALYYAGTTRRYPVQPEVTLSGTTASIRYTFPAAQLSVQAYHEIGWEGRTRINGNVTSTRFIRNATPQSQTLTIAGALIQPITVTVLGSVSSGGGGGTVDAYTKAEVNTLLAGKANAATSLGGYGISDAYTQAQVNTLLSGKAATATTLSGYGIANAYTSAQVDNLLAGKVNVATGKGLSTEDYTTAEKTKLAGLSNFNLTLTTTGSSGPATLSGSTLNIPQYGGGGGGGDMFKATYDGDGDNIVDQTEAVPWTGVSGKPTFASVATSGAYTDLTGRPTLGTASSLNVAATGNAATGEVVKGNDTRLSDARTPTAHTQTASTITDFQATVSANTDVTANTSSRHSHSNKTLLDNTTASFTSADESKIDALGTASTRNAPASGNAASAEVVLGSDSRLSDARTPTTHTHTKSQITDFSHTHVKADITDFAHTHAISDVTGLQTALDGKQGALTLTTTGTSGAATLSGNTLNIPNYATGGGGGSSVAYQKITTTSTIAPTAAITTISVDNGSTAVAVNLDAASSVGATVFVKRYDTSSSGNVQINANGTAQVQNTLGAFGDGILLPTGGGTRQWGFVWNGTNYELISQ
ncbi:hypothetical protein DYU11_11540 [Fibrisoma montanum]|uniref:CHRD domain-containing protein n=1 Tax=Fibrisoma montanum TaxID=2305895 RepID=A0A418MB50_9BACT|nr:hypothetical protein [Fibrisoma montanum]RIV23607.1 hypothetical protein DYU11_11540 [Fibrisoma montanum]